MGIQRSDRCQNSPKDENAKVKSCKQSLESHIDLDLEPNGSQQHASRYLHLST